ncbi:MAG: hypothetical protein AB9842_04905 [Bacteroidales bacterium]
MKKIFPIAILILLFACHFPYLTADPDTITDIHTRGAWTDEGLYSSQIRNYLIDGDFNLKESSTFVRGPLFNILQLPFFYVLGNHRLVGRILVLLITFLVPLLFLKLKDMETFTFFAILVVFGQFHIFHFCHYALAEMLCIDMIFISLFFFLKSQADKSPFGHRVWFILIASLSIFIAYALKIQYIYAAAILPVTLFIMAFFAGKEREEAFQLFGYSLIFSLILIGIYALWYVANKDFYNYVMLNEVQGRYPSRLGDFYSIIKFNFNYFLWVRELKSLWIALPIAGLIVLWQRHSRKTEKRYFALWMFSIVWIVFELHKLPMSYLPNRYLLPLYFASGLLIAQGLSSLYSRSSSFSLIAILFGLLFLGLNLPYLYKTYQNRTYDLDRLNEYLSKYEYDGSYGMGSWATASSWGTDMKTLPVWRDYFNAKDPLRTVKPTLVITEFNESESDKAYASQGIDLRAVSDSVREFPVWRYKVMVYWIKK